MNTTLVVVRAFASHAKGDVVTDPAEIAAILGGEQAHAVVRVITPSPAPTSSSGS